MTLLTMAVPFVRVARFSAGEVSKVTDHPDSRRAPVNDLGTISATLQALVRRGDARNSDAGIAWWDSPRDPGAHCDDGGRRAGSLLLHRRGMNQLTDGACS